MAILELALPAAISGIASAFGQERANRTNMRLAREQMAFQANSAREAMAFEERMSSTAISRRMADLRSAGLNPILAGTDGASTPGAPAMSGASATVQDAVGPGVSSAMQAIAMRKQMRLLDAQVNKALADANTAWVANNQAKADLDFRRGEWSYYFEDDGRPKEPFRRLMEAQFGEKIANSARSISESELSRLSIPERKAIATLFEVTGSGGKGIQMLLPLIQTLFNRR